MTSSGSKLKYPKLVTRLPPYLHARLHATSTVLGTPVEQLIESALDAQFTRLDEPQRELIDRVAASLIHTTEFDEVKK